VLSSARGPERFYHSASGVIGILHHAVVGAGDLLEVALFRVFVHARAASGCDGGLGDILKVGFGWFTLGITEIHGARGGLHCGDCQAHPLRLRWFSVGQTHQLDAERIVDGVQLCAQRVVFIARHEFRRLSRSKFFNLNAGDSITLHLVIDEVHLSPFLLPIVVGYRDDRCNLGNSPTPTSTLGLEQEVADLRFRIPADQTHFFGDPTVALAGACRILIVRIPPVDLDRGQTWPGDLGWNCIDHG